MSSTHSTSNGSLLHNQDGNWQQNPDGNWSKAIPLPLYGFKKTCQCGKSFWKEANYRKHYQQMHTDGVSYKRTPTGLLAEERKYS